MATAPLKSQPLHNFSLPCLKWGHKNQINGGNRFRRSAGSAHDSPPTTPRSVHVNASQSPKSESEVLNRLNLEAVDVEGVTDGGNDCSEKIFGADESSEKPWNLRPRKVVSKAGVEIGTVSKKGVNNDMATTATAIPLPGSESHPKSMRLRGFAESHVAERRAKRKFWLALSWEEVEEDVYAMTGFRPARRPKKRSKNVQKHIDNVFPGSYLVGVSAGDYLRVDETLR